MAGATTTAGPSTVGINLGKSKATPLDEAPEDYLYSFSSLKDLADFFVVNVSSPNFNLRQLQDKAALGEILAALQEANDAQQPILVKVRRPPASMRWMRFWN